MDNVKSGTPRPIQSPSPDLTKKPRAAAAPATASAPSKTAPKTNQGAPPWWPSGSKTEAGAKPDWVQQAKPTTTTDSAPQDSDPRDKYSMALKGNDAQLAMAKLVRTRVSKNGLTRVSAGAYAERRGSTAGRYGTASYKASAKAEARAEISANSKLNLNGLNAKGKAYAGLTAEASLTGSLVTKPYNLAGVSMTAGVEATGKLSATAGLDARGQMQVTSYPPTAIVRGSARASAVAKVKGTITGRLGPVGVTANGYLSAGAEAKTSGIAGYQDGTLKLGASTGAAAGVGAGCGLQVEVDCSGKPASSKPASGKLARNKPAIGKLDPLVETPRRQVVSPSHLDRSRQRPARRRR